MRAPGVACETRLVEGHPWETIVAEATGVKSPLVVVSTHIGAIEHASRGTVTERLLGSTADRVVRHAPCPVLVAPADLDLPRTLEGARWLVAIDFHEPSVEALRTARLFAERTGGTLETIHVVHRAEVDANQPWRSSLHGHAKEMAVKRLAELGAAELARTPGPSIAAGSPAAARPPHPHFRMAERVSEGDTIATLVDAAHEQRNTVLVMGTHGRGGLARLALGSTTERVLRRADVPVLCVRRIDAAHA